MLMSSLLLHTASAGVLLEEEELLKISDLVVEGEVISAACTGYAIGTDPTPSWTHSYEAVISVADVIVGEAGESVVITTRRSEQFTEDSDVSCFWEAPIHAEGEVARFYLGDAGDGTYGDVEWSEPLSLDGSSPAAVPDCGAAEYDAEVDAYLGGEEYIDTGDPAEPGLEVDPTGCSTAGGAASGVFGLLSALAVLRRRE